MKIVGIQSVVSTTKAGEETSHAVYPRASNVLRIPPLGKEEASGSCWMSSLPEKRSMTSPFFSEFDEAVMFLGCTVRQRLEPVRVVGNVQGFAQLFMPFAIRSAISLLMGVPFSMASVTAL